MPELEELQALLEEIEAAPLLQKAALAEGALRGIVEALDGALGRIESLERRL